MQHISQNVKNKKVHVHIPNKWFGINCRSSENSRISGLVFSAEQFNSNKSGNGILFVETEGGVWIIFLRTRKLRAYFRSRITFVHLQPRAIFVCRLIHFPRMFALRKNLLSLGGRINDSRYRWIDRKDWLRLINYNSFLPSRWSEWKMFFLFIYSCVRPITDPSVVSFSIWKMVIWTSTGFFDWFFQYAQFNLYDVHMQ